MAGEIDLQKTLAALQPERRPGEYVFVSLPAARADLKPIVQVVETEGVTVVVDRLEADAQNLPYDYVAVMITLRIHTALEAVGLTAAVSNALAAEGLSCNVVAGYYHDHLFVSADRADDAMAALAKLSRG